LSLTRLLWFLFACQEKKNKINEMKMKEEKKRGN